MAGEFFLVVAGVASILLTLLLLKGRYNNRLIKNKKENSLVRTIVFSVFVIIVIGSISISVYYLLDNQHSEIKQDIQSLENEIEETLANIGNSNSRLNNLESELLQYQNYLEENNTELNMLKTGNEFLLHNPTYDEAIAFLDVYNNENASLVIKNAKKQGIRCAYVIVRLSDGIYSLIGFDTIDEGMIYFEPITNYRVFPEIGEYYAECVQGRPYYSMLDDTIIELLVGW
jgi:phage regulator Rha-like protein